MRRGVFDVLRRGIDNTVANWPLTAIRLGETLAFGFIAVATAIAVFVPIFVSMGLSLSDLKSPESVAAMALMLAGKWVLMFWIFVVISVLLFLFIAIHAFVEAGRARLFVAGERAAGLPDEGPRSRFAVTSVQEWVRGGAEGWWELFWIYNLAWGLAGLIVIVPLVPTMLLILVLRSRPAFAIGTGCFGLLFTLLLGVVLGVLTKMWTNRAVCEWAARRRPAREALADAWRVIRDDFTRHAVVALAILVVGVTGSIFFASFSFFAGFGAALGDQGIISLFTLPVRVVSSILSSILSAAIGSWYLACYAALTVEGEGNTER